MVNLINSWVKGIVIAVVISTIIEMLLPEGNIKKYVKTVIGVYIVFTIISPIITKITGKEISLSSYELPKASEYRLTSIDTNSYIETTYINNIKQDIIKNIEKLEYKVESLEIQIDSNAENYGTINKIELKISKKNETSNAIEPIEIKIVEEQIKEEITEEEKENIKIFLENNYGITKQNIIINP